MLPAVDGLSDDLFKNLRSSELKTHSFWIGNTVPNSHVIDPVFAHIMYIIPNIYYKIIYGRRDVYGSGKGLPLRYHISYIILSSEIPLSSFLSNTVRYLVSVSKMKNAVIDYTALQ